MRRRCCTPLAIWLTRDSAVGTATRARSPCEMVTMPERSSACRASRTAGRPTR